jgi:hypothetical protein
MGRILDSAATVTLVAVAALALAAGEAGAESARPEHAIAGWELQWQTDLDFIATVPGFRAAPLGPHQSETDRAPALLAVESFVFGHPEVFRLDPDRERLVVSHALTSGHDVWFEGYQTHDGVQVQGSTLWGCLGGAGTLGFLQGRLLPGLTIQIEPRISSNASREVAERAYPGCSRSATRVSGPFVNRWNGREVVIWWIQIQVGADGRNLLVDATTHEVLSDSPRWKNDIR